MLKEKRFVDKVLGKLGYTKKGVGPLVDDSRLYRSLRSYLSSVDGMEVTDPYEKSVWVFASINAIAQNIARVPFYIYEEKQDNMKTVITDGELYKLFMNPNPYMIGHTLFFSTVLFMELYGEAFWIMEGRDNITQIPKEIWSISPTRMEPLLDDKGQFNGYWVYRVKDFKTVFAPHQILHFKYFNPYDDVRGLSGIQASRLGVEQDYFASKYNKQFFKDGISLSGMVQAPDFLTDEQFNRLKNQFEERHAGYSNAHKVGIIEGGAQFIETKGMSQRDMEFSVLKTVIRGEILAAFKTNEVVLGNYENIQSYEGIKQAHESFWKETLLPKIIYLEEFLWAKFFNTINAGKNWGAWDISVIEALKEDFANKVEMAKTLTEIGFSLNAVNTRLDLGFERVPWGDTWYVKMGMVPVEYVMDGPPEPTEPTEPGKEPGSKPTKPADDEPEPSDPDEGKKEIQLSDREDAMWANFISRQIPVENIFKSKLKRYLYDQRKRVLSGIYNNVPIEALVGDKDREGLAFLLKSLYLVGYQTGKELLKEELLIEDIEYKEVEDLMTKRVEFSSATITNTLKNSILKILEENKSKGANVKADLIRALYNRADNRMSTIARTESSAIINGIRFIMMQKQGVRFHKWLSKSDKGRHSHFHGMVVRLGESFSKDFILRYPHDTKAPVGEVINCLCYTVPVIQTK